MTAEPSFATRLARMLTERDERNVDNVARTESYLELYRLCREHGVELPWLLMAHLVSRNAGYLMTDLAERPDGGGKGRPFTLETYEEMFLFLERPNFLIFRDAWHHVLHHLLGWTSRLDIRTPRFMRHAWARYERARSQTVEAAVERALVMDLVTNEQHLIERRAVHHPHFARARAVLGFVESVGADRPIVLPLTDARIKVGGFMSLERRIAAGQRIFDEALASRAAREDILGWCSAHPHTGSRLVYDAGRAGPTLREVWPVSRVRGLWGGVHDEPEPDPAWP